MAKDGTPQNAGPKKPDAVVAKPQKPQVEGPQKCSLEECKKKPEKFGFCMEHYEWYMEGMIRGDGRKPVDFEAKMERHLAKKAKKQKAA